MIQRATLAGLGLGFILNALLYYPLYVVLPAHYVADWPAGSAAIGLTLEIVAGLATIAGGFLVARWAGARTRAVGAALGALAGGLAALVLFSGLGAAAAGTIGSAAILRHGPLPAESDAQFMGILVDSVTRIVWASYMLFWALMAGGALLGALGGLLAPVTAAAPTAADGFEWGGAIAVTGVLTTTLSLVVATVVFALLPESIGKAAAEYNIAPPYPTAGVFLWPAMTAFVFYLAALATLLFVIKAQGQRATDPASLAQASVSAYVGGLIPLLIIPFIFLINRPFVLTLWFIVPAAASVVMAVLMLRLGAEFSRRGRAAAGVPPASLPLNTSVFILGFPILAFIVKLALDRFLPGVAGAFSLIALIFYLVAVLYLMREHRPAAAPPIPGLLAPASVRKSILGISLGAGLAMLVPACHITAAALSLVLMPVVAIVVLANYPSAANPNPSPVAATFTSASLVRDLYSVQAQMALIYFGLTVLASALGFLLIVGFVRLLQRRLTPAKP